MRRRYIFMMVIITIIVLIVCWLIFKPHKKEMTSVGFLFPDTMYDQTWGTEGYRGMLEVVQTYDNAFYYEQNVKGDEKITKAVEEMAARGVPLIYGQGTEYSHIFNRMASKYPDIHFVVFNGDSKHDNVTAVNINGYAMGFFSGMIASHESRTHHIGVLGAYKSQPEIKGYIDGAQFENKQTKIYATYVNTYSYDPRGKRLAEEMIKEQHVDVVFPAADGINSEVMALLKEKAVSSIGYISDQSNYGPQVLVSMKLNLSKAYVTVAEDYHNGTLAGGVKYYGIDEGMVDLTPISYTVSPDYKKYITDQLNKYKSTHILPNGKLPPKQYDELSLQKNHPN